MEKIPPKTPEPGMNRTGSTDDELNAAGKENAQQAREAGRPRPDTSSTSGSTNDDGAEIVDSEYGAPAKREHRTDDKPASYWKTLLDKGDYDAILDAAANGNKSAKEWLKDNSLLVQRELQNESMLFHTMSNVSRTMHEMTMAAVRNIKA